ncbi:MAG: CRISPR system precrRNA processing endoribonuclease RAMP protein Cas6, partial [Tepidiformaceae bacterium]
FRVDSVASAPLSGSMTALYDYSKRRLTTYIESISVDAMPPAPTADEPITLTFITPTRLVHNAQTSTPAEFHVLFRNVLRRVNFLNHFHCGGGLCHGAGELVAEGEAVRAVASHLQWQEWGRYSARQGQRVPMGGFVGEVTYEGDLARLWPWLALGGWVHVGKGSAFGLGRYQIEREGRH